MAHTTFESFMEDYGHDERRQVIVLDLEETTEEHLSPFIVVRDGDRVMVVNPMALVDHTCIDVHSFIGGIEVTAGVMAMSTGGRVSLIDTGTKSHNWPSANLIAVLLGKQS